LVVLEVEHFVFIVSLTLNIPILKLKWNLSKKNIEVEMEDVAESLPWDQLPSGKVLAIRQL